MQFFLFFMLLSQCAFGVVKATFQEVWGYLMEKEETSLTQARHLTDICYFSAQVNEIGRITKYPKITNIPAKLRDTRRVHLVISAPGNRSLMYWCLKQDTAARDALLSDITSASLSFDGVQIDFETIRLEEKEAFLSFLRLLRAQLPEGKLLSVALPARTRFTEDAFDYEQIGQIVDKVVVMAYDEHYRGGSPGSIASLKWCERVCSYAKTKVPHQKLIMGLPLYGRVWQKQAIAKALKYPQTLELWKQFPNILQKMEDGTAYFSFQQTVDAVVYYESEESLLKKLLSYQAAGVETVALWRLSQEPASFWSHLALHKR